MKINITKLKENAPTIINALILLAICIGICVLDSKLDEMDRSLSWEISSKSGCDVDTRNIERQLESIEAELERQTKELQQWRLEREQQRSTQRQEQIQREWERSRYRY